MDPNLKELLANVKLKNSEKNRINRLIHIYELTNSKTIYNEIEYSLLLAKKREDSFLTKLIRRLTKSKAQDTKKDELPLIGSNKNRNLLEKGLVEIYKELQSKKLVSVEILEKIHQWSLINDQQLPEELLAEYKGYYKFQDVKMPDCRYLPLRELYDHQGYQIELFEFDGETDPRWYNYKNEFKTQILQSLGELTQLFSGSSNVFLDITSIVVEMVKKFPKIKVYRFPSSIKARIPEFQFEKILAYVDQIMVEFTIEKLKVLEYDFQSTDIRFNSELMDLIKSKEIIQSLEKAWKCYENDIFDAGSIMLRKALETSLHIALKIGEGNDDALYDSSRNPYSLPKKIEIVKGNGLISNFLAQDLKSKTKFFGDLGAHDSLVTLKREDFESANISLQKALEHLFRKAKGVK